MSHDLASCIRYDLCRLARTLPLRSAKCFAVLAYAKACFRLSICFVQVPRIFYTGDAPAQPDHLTSDFQIINFIVAIQSLGCGKDVATRKKLEPNYTKFGLIIL